MNIAEFLLPGMPELPEVETISRQLSKLIGGKKIKEVEVRLAKMVKTPLAQFKRALKGAKIRKVGRRAKLLVFELDNGWSFLAHLKMTGQMVYQSTASNKQLMAESKHTHLVFHFSDKTRLLFNDLRQFGYIKLADTNKLGEFFIKEGLGPEPLEKDFALADFEALLAKKPKAKIKQFLMDPKTIAGIGNIYSDEILFFAGVHPLRRNQSLKKGEIKKIYQGIKKILPEAIRSKGTSANNYLDAFGRKGGFLAKLKVYGREGENCVKCKGRVARIKIGGRSAHFCPACQK
ncbi:MAG: DNA-formamidopyrimidine glycosylase [Candidatus Portnoybacteria bacterium]|nr:DNA-formamidopyrimidine glycosylase [Candidatus Portnoybacteria bacterium]MDD4982949.1 DNA-formamidopyrimidine glycosylase [Candidatus Portnoybacteria bacterium]